MGAMNCAPTKGMKMKALLCREFGGLEKLTVEDLPSPTPGEGQVLVAVKFASVNYPDALTVQGKYQFKPPLPFTPGSEFSGIVKAVGPGVTKFKVGQAVLSPSLRGAF